MSVSWGRTWAIGRTEVRRRWRAAKANPAQLLSIALIGLFFVPTALALPFGAFFGGRAVASGEIETPLALAGRLCVTIWLFAAVFGLFRGYASLFDPDRRDGLLTTISHRQLLAGVLCGEALIIGLPPVAVAAAGAVLFAVGVGSVVAAPAAFLMICLPLSTGYLTGSIVALLLKNGGVRSRRLKRLRTIGSVVVFTVYLGVVFTNSVDAVAEPFYRLLTPTPLGWLGDLGLLSTGVGASPVRAGLSLAAGVGVLGLSAPVLVRLTEWLWYADGLEPARTETDSTDTTWLSRLLPQPWVGVVSVDWTRGRRAPMSFSYVIYPVLLLVTPVFDAIETGSVGTILPLALSVCGVWITGALFALNVLGNEGSVLPSTLLSPAGGRAIVGGHIAAGALVCLPVFGGIVAILGVLSPLSGGLVATLTVGTLIAGGAAGAIASGIGAALPRYEAVSVSRSRKAIIPSTIAFACYSVVIAVVVLPMMAAHTRSFGGIVESTLGVAPLGVAVVGVLITAVLAAAVGLVSVVGAIRRIDRYQFE